MVSESFCLKLIHRPPYDATLAVADEVVDQVSLVALWIATLYLYERLAIVESPLIQCAVDVVDQEDLLIGEASAT